MVKRSRAWISHFRRMAREFERYARTAMIHLMPRRLTGSA
jgi:hypothetical protein